MQILSPPSLTATTGADLFRSLVIRTTIQEPCLFPEDYEPNEFDVLCGRGDFHHIGNRQFRILIRANLDRYTSQKSRIAKANVIRDIINCVRDMGGHFLLSKKMKNGDTNHVLCELWYDVGDKAAKLKIGHAFRDAASNRKKKNAASKRQLKHEPHAPIRVSHPNNTPTNEDDFEFMQLIDNLSFP